MELAELLKLTALVKNKSCSWISRNQPSLSHIWQRRKHVETKLTYIRDSKTLHCITSQGNLDSCYLWCQTCERRTGWTIPKIYQRSCPSNRRPSLFERSMPKSWIAKWLPRHMIIKLHGKPDRLRGITLIFQIYPGNEPTFHIRNVCSPVTMCANSWYITIGAGM